MQDLTTGPVWRHLLATTSFMLVTMVFQTLYFLVDLYWVGHLGKEAVAAVGLAGNLMFIVLAVTQVLGVGTTTLVSHAAGRKEHDRALVVCNQSLVLSVLIGVAFGVLGMALRLPYANTLSADPSTASQTAAYLLWFIPALALQVGMTSLAAALRGSGNFKPGMIVQTATLIINIALAPFLIFGWFGFPALGVAGAALSTFVAVVVGTVWLSFYFLPKDAYLRFVPQDWTPRLDVWGRMLGIGLPAGAEFGLMAVYLFIVYAISRPFGAAAQAGFGIGMRIIQAGFMPVIALAFAVAPVAGQNFGARLPARVRETFTTALVLSSVMMVTLALACHIAPAAMIGVFSQDQQVVRVGEEFLKIVSWNFIASAVVFVCASMFQAMGNTIPSLLASFIRIIVVTIPAILLSRVPGFELRWVWYLSATSVTLQMLLCLFLLRRRAGRAGGVIHS
jgi:putative MATE family efflux protein